MSKKTIAIFFIFLFTAYLSAPSLIVAIDNSIDITILFGNPEEEENEKNPKLEILHLNNSRNREYFLTSLDELLLEYRYGQYSIPHLNLISPPPENI